MKNTGIEMSKRAMNELSIGALARRFDENAAWLVITMIMPMPRYASRLGKAPPR